MSYQLTPLIATIKGASLKDKLLFTKNLSLIIKAGMPLPRGLELLSLQVTSPLFQWVIAQIKNEVIKGKEFSEALSAYPHLFSPFYISMVKSGEASGTLEEALKHVAAHMEKERALRSKVLGALTYPAIVLAVMIIVIIVMMVFAVPKLTAVFKDFNVELPLMTRIVIGLSDFMVHNLLLLFLVTIGSFVVGWYFLFRIKGGRVLASWLALHIPLVATLTKKLNSARIARTLQTLISSGVPILKALSISAQVVQNHFYRAMLLEAGREVEKGKQLNEILKRYPGLYQPVTSGLVAIGEETGSLDVILKDLATFYEDEIDNMTKNLSSTVEPLLMVVIGVIVGFFAIAMLTPIYTLTSSISY